MLNNFLPSHCLGKYHLLSIWIILNMFLNYCLKNSGVSMISVCYTHKKWVQLTTEPTPTTLPGKKSWEGSRLRADIFKHCYCNSDFKTKKKKSFSPETMEPCHGFSSRLCFLLMSYIVDTYLTLPKCHVLVDVGDQWTPPLPLMRQQYQTGRRHVSRDVLHQARYGRGPSAIPTAQCTT